MGQAYRGQQPLFPNYLFLLFNPERMHTATFSAIWGISYFVRFSALLAPINYRVIKDLQMHVSNTYIDP